jgi:metal-responsive CopG/Arc/MetJ family transcriptional regulator
MSADTVRAHVVLPKELVDSIDDLVGRRARSKFLAEAAEEKLRRLRQIEAIERVAGSLKYVDIPGWETPESTVEWVRKSREEDDRRLDEIWRGR